MQLRYILLFSVQYYAEEILKNNKEQSVTFYYYLDKLIKKKLTQALIAL